MHRALREVHGRAPAVGLFVQSAALPHVMRDVRDVHAEPVVAVGQPLDGDGIVEIARVLAVDGHRCDVAEVRAPLDVALLHRVAETPRFLNGLFAMYVRDVELPDDDLGVDSGLVDAPEHLDHPSDRTARRAGPASDLDDHHLAWLGGRPLPCGHVHVGEHTAIERRDESQPGLVHLETSHDAALAALENLDDAAFGALLAAALDARHHAIAVHGLGQVGGGDVDVLSFAM